MRRRRRRRRRRIGGEEGDGGDDDSTIKAFADADRGLLEPSWTPLVSCETLLGSLGVFLGACLALFGLSWRTSIKKGAAQIHVAPHGPEKSPLGALFGRSWSALGRSWGRLGALLGPSWGCLGPSWGHLEASRAHRRRNNEKANYMYFLLVFE